ncbi:hypothetical protein [Moorena producens]
MGLDLSVDLEQLSLARIIGIIIDYLSSSFLSVIPSLGIPSGLFPGGEV